MTIKKNGLALLLVAFSANLWAHGDVVPQAVKTDGHITNPSLGTATLPSVPGNDCCS